MQGLLLMGELILLYILSHRLMQAMYDLVVLLFRSKTVGITVMSLITLPGTVIHELSHLFTAEVLGVRTGKLTIVPENIREEEVKTGSVMIAASDPFRRYIIGLAPIFTGLVCITTLSYILVQIVPAWGDWGIWGYLGMGYLLLAISNSMFSSPEDLKGFVPFAITLAILIAAAYVAGIRIGLTGPILAFVTKILDALTKSLGVVLALNIAGLLVMRLLIVLTEQTTRRKIIR